MRWSYKTIHFELKKEGLLGSAFLDVSEIEEVLNNYGRGGWELVSIIETGDGVMGILKQPIAAEGTRLEEDLDQTSPALQVVSPSAGTAALKKAADQSAELSDRRNLTELDRAGGSEVSRTVSFPPGAEAVSATAAELTTVRPERSEKTQPDVTGCQSVSSFADTREVQSETVFKEELKLEEENKTNAGKGSVLDSRKDDDDDDQDIGVGAIRIE